MLILGVLFLLQANVRSQDSVEKELIHQLDSMYRVLFTFNYSDESTYEPAFSIFQSRIDSIISLSAELELKRSYYKGANIKFLHLKYQDENELSRQLLDHTRLYALENNDSTYYGQFTYFLGSLFSRQEDKDSALVYFENALQIAKEAGDKQVEAASINAIAVVYAGLDRDDLAVEYYYKALKVSQGVGDTTQILNLFGNLATVYGRLEDGDSTLFYASKAFDLASKFDEPAVRWHALNSLTIGSYLKNDFRAAISYANKLSEEVTPIQELGFLITSHLYRSKSLAAQNKLKASYQYAVKSLELARDFEIVTNEMNALEWLTELTVEKRDFESALIYEKEKAHLQDSLNKLAANKRIESLSARYESQEKEEKIASLKAIQKETKARQKTQTLFLCVLILLLVVSFLYVYKVFKTRVAQEKIAKQKAKNELLRTQMNPHFLFNALSSIQLFLIDKGQGSHALSYLSKFAKLMRRILENSRRNTVSLDDEISTLRHYLDLQKIRFDNRFEYRIDVSTSDGLSEIMIPPMFAQPFIENSLEHGIADIKDGLIEVRFTQEKDILKFIVEDNGIGISRSTSLKTLKGHEPMATEITQDRIDLLKKQLKKNVLFSVKDKVSEKDEIIGTQVIFELPIQFA